jgi:hypothetical protein
MERKRSIVIKILSSGEKTGLFFIELRRNSILCLEKRKACNLMRMLTDFLHRETRVNHE